MSPSAPVKLFQKVIVISSSAVAASASFTGASSATAAFSSTFSSAAGSEASVLLPHAVIETNIVVVNTRASNLLPKIRFLIKISFQNM